MKIKLVRGAVLIGLLLFIVALVIDVGLGFFYPPLLVTKEFASRLHPLALTISIYSGLSLISGYLINILSTSKTTSARFSKKKFFGQLKKQAWVLFICLIISPLIGYLIYSMVINIPATLLHKNAQKETIQFEAIATSAWPARKDIRKNCQHHLLFDSPKISSEIQFICINQDQWLYFRGIDFPVTVTLYGKKSFYGYELDLHK